MSIAIGIDPFTTPDLGPAEFIRAASAAGFTHAGLRTVQPGGPNPGQAKVDASNIDAVEQAIAETGIRIVSTDILDLSRGSDFEAVAAGLPFAARLGATSMLVFSRSDDADSIGDGLARLCDIALPLGISPKLEAINYTAIHSLAQAADIVGRHPGAGLIIDTLHLHRTGATPDEVRAVAEAFPISFQINGVSSREDLDRRYRESGSTEPNPLRWEAVWGRLLPGEGDNDVASIAAVLPAGTIPLVEAPNAARVEAVGPGEHLRQAFEAACRALATDVIQGGVAEPR